MSAVGDLDLFNTRYAGGNLAKHVGRRTAKKINMGRAVLFRGDRRGVICRLLMPTQGEAAHASKSSTTRISAASTARYKHTASVFRSGKPDLHSGRRSRAQLLARDARKAVKKAARA